MIHGRTHRLTIRTPEGVTFTLALAGPISRCLAWLVDSACIVMMTQIVGALMALLVAVSPDVSMALSIVLFFIINTAYTIVLEWRWHGQTLGKRVVGLRVMDIRGLRLNASQVIMRNLLRAVDSLPFFYLVGGAACLINRHGQRLGDLAANTVVIQQGKAVEPDLETLMEENRYNSLRDYPHLAARLRQKITPEEAAIALRAIMRRNELSPDARVALYNEMAAFFRKKAAFPQEAVEGVSSEHYLRNIVDILFCGRK